jgi:hypothetical protein
MTARCGEPAQRRGDRPPLSPAWTVIERAESVWVQDAGGQTVGWFPSAQRRYGPPAGRSPGAVCRSYQAAIASRPTLNGLVREGLATIEPGTVCTGSRRITIVWVAITDHRVRKAVRQHVRHGAPVRAARKQAERPASNSSPMVSASRPSAGALRRVPMRQSRWAGLPAIQAKNAPASSLRSPRRQQRQSRSLHPFRTRCFPLLLVCL